MSITGLSCFILTGLGLTLPLFGESLPIIDAAKNMDTPALRILLREKVNVNAAEPDGATALHWACYRDDVESTDLLIRAGANVNAANDLGATPLWNASLNGNAVIVKRLLDAGANPNATLLEGETLIMVAARSGHVDVVQALLARGGNPNARAARGQTALMWAVAQKHPDVVKLLLANRADVQARTEVWSRMMAVPPHGHPDYNRLIPHGSDTALMFAARVGCLDSARLLVDAGANVNDTDAWAVSATVMAAHSGYSDLVEFLLGKGADANQAAAGFTALHAAIMRRDERMVRALLAHGANPDTPLRVWTPTRRSSRDFHFPPVLVGATPVWLAARFLQPEVVRLLVQRGADPLFVHRSAYVKDDLKQRNESITVLMAATGMGGGTAWVQPAAAERSELALETVKLLIGLGVDVNAVNTDGRTALDSAKALGYDNVVKLLMEKGAAVGRAITK